MSGGDNALDLAARRLEQAVHVLEQRLAQRLKTAEDAVAAELDEARARERELEAAGAEASAALGRAILEIRAALNGSAPPSSSTEH